MKLTNSIKAIIIDGTRLLVVHLRNEDGKEYYTLPGGKQEPNELMIDALKREVKEETGYTVEPKSLLFIREGFNGDSHRIEFMFICDIVSEKENDKLLYDVNQIGTKWISIDNILHEELYPVDMRNIIKRHFLGKNSEIYLGEMK
ncbi:MAG: NUDIX domain-containing protein [Clostridia bacterium]|nr:NUDIX domain-containing protein [Clostridia bacterium]